MKGSIHSATGEVERVQKLNFFFKNFTVEGEGGGSFFFFFFPDVWKGGRRRGETRFRELRKGKALVKARRNGVMGI